MYNCLLKISALVFHCKNSLYIDVIIILNDLVISKIKYYFNKLFRLRKVD